MTKHYCFFLVSVIAALCAIAGSSSAQTASASGQADALPAAFSVSPQVVRQGTDMTVTYDPTKTYMKGRTDIRSVLYQWKDYYWHAIDKAGRRQAGVSLSRARGHCTVGVEIL